MSDLKAEKVELKTMETGEEKAVSALVAIEQSRAVQEVQAALVIAKKFPRDQVAAFAKIITACKRPALAEKACYSYPRGGQVITGPSIRLAEVLIQNWGNADFGIRELERKGTSSICEAYCWDQETNVRQTKIFEVPHERVVGKGAAKTVTRLTDPRDIYELVANNGARRLRACILGIIPGDIVEEAVRECKKTTTNGNGEPLSDRIRKTVTIFQEIGVTQEMISKRLKHDVADCTREEVSDLLAIYNTLKDNQSKRGDFFDFKEEEESNAKTVAEKIKTAAQKTPDQPKETDSKPTTEVPEFDKDFKF